MKRIIFGLVLVLLVVVLFGCETITYQVTFKSEFHQDFIESVNANELVKRPDELTYEGYKFIDWYLGDAPYDFNSAVTENITLVAKWEKLEFTISYQTIDGILLDSVKASIGEKLEKPTSPEKVGYEFIGWYSDELFEKEYDFDNVVNSDLTIYAKFEEVKYTISYELDGGICETLITEFKYNESVLLDEPSKEGFKFIGWYQDDQRIEIIENKNYQLVAKWEELEKYHVSYDLNGGKFNEEVMSKFEKEITSVGSFNITQMNFYFWDIYANNIFIYTINENPNPIYALRLGIKEVNNGYLVVCKYLSGANDKDFSSCDYVIVVSEHNTQGYSLVNGLVDVNNLIVLNDFNNELLGQVSVKADVVEEGELTTAGKFYQGEELLMPERSGYEFLGWFDEENQKVEKVLDKDINLIAKWERVIGSVEEELDLIELNLSKQFTTVISEDLTLKTSDEEVGATISWKSSNENIISNTGKVTKVLGKVSKVVLTATITLKESVRIVDFNVNVAKGYKDLSKGGIVAGYNYTANIPDDTTFKNVDILYCAFGEVGTNGKISNYSSIVSNTKKYIDKAHAYGDYVIISISTSNLATVAASDSLINIFVDDLVRLINECDLDGIDMDWETPTQATKTNYTRLMKVVREKVKANNPAHLVTSALGAGPWQYVKFDLENSHKYLDYINLMSYDMQTNAKASYQNALYKSSKGYTLTQCSIDQTLPLYNALGVPNEKIIIGVPFYARVFKNTNGLGQASEANGSATQEFLYTNFLSKTVSGVTVGWDDECKVPYIYDANNKKFYSYENEKSIGIKCQYIHDKGLAGMMYWQRTQDYNNKLLNAIYSNKKVMENK